MFVPVFRSGTIAALCLCGGILVPGLARADVGGLMRRGNGLYARQKYDEALEAYQQAEVLEPDATAIHYNLGNTLYRQGKHQEAASELELVLTDKKPVRRANAMYNIGNTMFRAGQLDGAIKSYVTALVINPADRQAKENLEFCLKKKQEQKPDSSKQQQQQNQQQQQQQQQQPQPQPQMSQDQAERVIQAIENKEKDQQEKQHQARQKKQVEKDW